MSSALSLILFVLLLADSLINCNLNCAICFFGLPKKFKSIVYPSIKENILQTNPSCDIFVHTYSVTSTTKKRHSKTKMALDVEEILLLEAVKYIDDIVAEVDLKRNITSYLEYFPEKNKTLYSDSIINMMRQWYSIERVWYAMEAHAQYDIVGMFRLDVKYATSIFMNEGEAVIPTFMNWSSHQYNDRMFYGLWKYVKMWSTSRFDMVPQYLMTLELKGQLHSESFMYYMLTMLEIPVITKPICFWRVRANGYISTNECIVKKVIQPTKLKNAQIKKRIPPNEGIKDKFDLEKQKKMHLQVKKVDTQIKQSVDSRSNCAMCFFGLPKKFKSIVYPSIYKNILQTNPGCDIFVHTYNLTKFTNRRNGENNVAIHVEQILLLKAVKYVYDILSDVDLERNVTSYLQYFPQNKGWRYPDSMINMIRQWHSIERVWYAMEAYSQYKIVGMFRLDVKYVTPIFMNDGEAVIPSFTNWPGHETNDRMFYGIWKYAKVWSTSRFDLVPQYLMAPRSHLKKGELHSEAFMFYLLTTLQIPVIFKPICFWRVRGTRHIEKKDCEI